MSEERWNTGTFGKGQNKEKKEWLNEQEQHFRKISHLLETPLADGGVSVTVKTRQGRIPRWAYEGTR